ncbi:MAG: B-box zinc finger protein [Chloroflexi bacterium]|nr:B-box zinc finger protein [Chloroflexota bacterium]
MTVETSESIFCANHPDRETSLRCNKCGKPICVKCARRMPTGYRCPECVNQQQQIFETALWYDYVIAAVVSAFLSGLAGALITRLGWFVFFLSPMAGGVIAEVIFRAVQKRRGKYLPWAAVGGVVLGALPLCALPLIVLVFSLFAGGDSGLSFGSLFSSLWLIVYVVMCASTLYYRLRGIRIN